MTNLSVPIAATIAVAWNGAAVPALAAIAGELASMRFLEFCSARSAAALGKLTRTVLPGKRVCDNLTGARRAQDRTKLGNPELPGDRDHSLSAERRHAGKAAERANRRARRSSTTAGAMTSGRVDCDLVHLRRGSMLDHDTNSALLEVARAFRPRIIAERDHIEAARRIPEDIAQDLAGAGFFRIFLHETLVGST
jgi:hypothetical protein